MEQRGIEASLTILRGPDRGRRFQLQQEVNTIGRDSKVPIRLFDTEVSRRHAEIRQTSTGYIIRDLQSSNGTFVNRERVAASRPLQNGDHIEIGGTELLFYARASQQEDLASKIRMISQTQNSEASAVIRQMQYAEGSQILRHPELATTPWLKDALTNLAVLYETSEAINRIADVDLLLEHIMDLAFRSINADRGFIVLRDAETGKLQPRCVRYRNRAEEEDIVVSRTIVDWVLHQDQGVIILDAARDERFRDAQSVMALGMRELMCVPLKGRHDTFGVMYADSRTETREVLTQQQPVRFTDDHLKLMIAVSHQAGLAIEDNRFYQAMVQAERLAAIGQTIAALSHHIKNILQGFRSGNDLIEMGLKEQNFNLMEHGWGALKKNQQRIYNLVLDMLTFSKDREPDFDLVDLNEICREVVELMASRAAERNLRLQAKLNDKLPAVLIEPEGIHRALLNIVTNALDAIEGKEDGHVIVQTAIDPKRQWIRVTVQDNGCGIEKDHLDQIFQVFYSSKGAKGTGLGLAVSRKIIREHGGDIRVVSAPGVGSRFILEIPFRQKDHDSNQSYLSLDGPTVTGNKNQHFDPMATSNFKDSATELPE